MTVPAVTAQISSAQPGATPVWVDVSSRFRSGSVRRGRNRQLEKAGAGTLAATFSNKDRGLDPEYSGGVLGANLRPMRRIRLRASYPGDTVNLLSLDASSFEGSDGGWTGLSNATVVRDGPSANAPDGLYRLAITAVATGNAIARSPYGSSGAPVVEGRTYTARFEIRPATTVRTAYCYIGWIDAAGTDFANSGLGTGVVEVLGDVVTVSRTAVAPAGAVRADVRAYVASAAAGETHRIDKVSLHEGTSTSWGLTYPVFDGFIDSIAQEYDGPHEARAAIVATDGFKILEGTTLESPWVVELRGGTAPKGWWRLGEKSGIVAVDQSGNGLHGTIVGLISWGTEGLVYGDTDTAFTFPSTGQAGVALYPISPLGALTWAIEFWIKSPPAPNTAGVYSWLLTGLDITGASTIGKPGSLSLYTFGDLAGSLPNCLRVLIGDITGPSVISSVPVYDDQPHHVVIKAVGGSPLRIFVDGVDRSTFQSGTATVIYPQWWSLGGGSATAVTVDEFRYYESTVPTDAEILTHYQRGSTGWPTEAAEARIGRILDQIGWPAADRQLGTGGEQVTSGEPGGMSALAYLQTVEDTDGGLLHMTADGKLRFVPRTTYLAAPYTEAQATFGDATGELGYTELGYEFSDDLVRNVIQRQRVDGALIEVSDAASIAEYQRKTDSQTGTLEADELRVWYLAAFDLDHHKDARSSITGLRVAPQGNPAGLYPQVLGRLLGDRVTVKRRPQNVGTAISSDQMIEGVDHDFGPKSWRTTFALDSTNARLYARWDISTFDSADARWAA